MLSLTGAGEAVAEANLIEYTKMYDACFKHLVGVEKPYNWYYMVYKPYTKIDDQAKCNFDHVRKHVMSLNPLHYVITREIYAKRYHYNVIVALSYKNVENDINMFTNRYKYSRSLLFSIEDRLNALKYILKEYKIRNPKEFIDYYIYSNGSRQVV